MGQVCLLVIFRVEIADVGLVQGVGVGHDEARHAVLPLNLEFAAYYFTTFYNRVTGWSIRLYITFCRRQNKSSFTV